MPINKTLTGSCPLLLESDTLSLSPYLVLHKVVLHDKVLGIDHQIHRPADVFLGAIANTTTYRALLQLADQQQVDRTALQELLGFLNRIGGLQRLRSKRDAIRALRIHCLHLSLGIRYMPLAYRKKAVLTWLIIGVLRATTPVILAAGVVAGLAAAAELAPLGSILGLLLYWLTLFCGSIVVHELAHAAVLKRYGLQSHVLQTRMRLGVIHAKAAPAIEVFSSLAGPLCGIVLCAIAGLAAWQWHNNLVGWSSILVALCHLFSLLPFYGDGASLHEALQERKRTT